MKVKVKGEYNISSVILVHREYSVILPEDSKRRHTRDLGLDHGSYLLECDGGHTSDSVVPAYWVSKNRMIITEICTEGGIVRLGQKWKIDNMIVEVLEIKEGKSCCCRVVNKGGIYEFDFVGEWSIGSSHHWTYLEGQDAPEG